MYSLATKIPFTLTNLYLLVKVIHTQVIMSNSLSISRKKIGFFCYKCGRHDFGNNQKFLSAHVWHCFYDAFSNSQSKRKSHNGPTSCHSSGTPPYPFLVKKTRVSGNAASGMDDIVQYECDNSDEIQIADEFSFWHWMRRWRWYSTYCWSHSPSNSFSKQHREDSLFYCHFLRRCSKSIQFQLLTSSQL